MVFPMMSPTFRHSGRCVSVGGYFLQIAGLLLDFSDDDDMTLFFFLFLLFLVFTDVVEPRVLV